MSPAFAAFGLLIADVVRRRLRAATAPDELFGQRITADPNPRLRLCGIVLNRHFGRQDLPHSRQLLLTAVSPSPGLLFSRAERWQLGPRHRDHFKADLKFLA